VLIFTTSLVSFAAKIPSPEPDVVKLLPKSGEVKGWEISQNSITYGAGKTLTDIYNGGYELYTKNGVLDAAQQMYTDKKDFTIVTIHQMDSEKSAERFLEYWQKADSKRPTFKLLDILTKGYVYTADGSANAYLIREKYFVTVNVYIDGEKGRSTAEEFLKTISASIEKLTKPVNTADQKQSCPSGR
jgi:hypothetical protein